LGTAEGDLSVANKTGGEMNNIPDAYKIYKLDEVEYQESKITIDPEDGCIYIREDQDDK